MVVSDGKKDASFSSKRCPDCSTEMPLSAKRCPGCDKRVGRVDSQGRAKKPVDWRAYVICVLAWLTFAVYTWWAFFRK